MLKKKGTLVVLAIAIWLIAVGSSTKVAFGNQVFRLGICMALSGPAAGWGVPLANGTRLVVDEINSKGGLTIGGEKYLIKVYEQDTKFTAEGAVSAARRLIDQHHVHMIMGAIAGHSTLAAQEVTEPAKVISLSTAADNRIIIKDEGKQFSFRVYISYSEVQPAMVKWLAKTYPEKTRLMLLDPNLTSSWRGHEIMNKLAPLVGLEIVYEEYYEDGLKDFYPFLIKALSNKPEIFFNTSSPPPDWALHIKQAKELGFKGVLIENHPTGLPTLESIAGKSNIGGLYGVDYPETQAITEFKTKYEKIYGEYNPYSLLVVGGLATILHAYEIAGTLNSEKVVEILEEGKQYENVMGIEGVFSGKTIYGRNAQWLHRQVITQVRNGNIKEVADIRIKDIIDGYSLLQ